MRYGRTSPNPGSTSSSIGRQAFSSQHEGGVQFVLADGSIRFVSENIQNTAIADAPTWKALPNPNDMGLYQRLHCKNCGLVVGEF